MCEDLFADPPFLPASEQLQHREPLPRSDAASGSGRQPHDPSEKRPLLFPLDLGDSQGYPDVLENHFAAGEEDQDLYNTESAHRHSSLTAGKVSYCQHHNVMCVAYLSFI